MWVTAVLGALLAARLAGDALASPLDPPPRLPGLSLSPFVRHWEPARYVPLRDETRRRRAAAASAPAPAATAHPLRITFNALNRVFRLRLRQDPGSVFAPDAEFHSTGGALPFSDRGVYTGTLEDEEDSHVYGVLTSDGLFDGTISTPFEEYYVEPLHRYAVQSPSSSLHSVIYRHSDVVHPSRNVSKPCASQLLHHKLQNGVGNSIFDLIKNEYHAYDFHSDASRRTKRWLPQDEEMQEDEPRKNPDLPLDLDVPYTRNDDRISTRKPKTTIDKSNLIIKMRDFDDDANSRPKPKTHVENHVIKTKAGVVTVHKDIVRKEPVKGFTVISAVGNSTDDRQGNKRASVDPRKTTCMVYLQADHMFYQRYGSEEACIEVMTRHVQKVNAIYKVTDFNQDGKPDNITFMIKRVKVHTLDALKEPSYRFPNNYGVEKYLELFSEEDYDAFCLAYMFTYRDFEMGTLGLAWTGDLKNAGGVCEKNGHYRGSMKSLNTGIVTLLNYGKHVPPAVSHVTLAHEIGHNFGSPHDPEVCTPGGEDGNYIMFARATSGDKRNNNKFSPCSLRAIDPVLNNKARSHKGCFTEPQPAICGNGVVEEGEQCDCGWASECTDACCHPQAARPHHTPCTLTEHSACSPSQGPCCTAKCTLKFGEKCRDDNGCRDSSYCDGKRAQCPTSKHKPNRTRCDKEFVCYMGECTGSICLAYGLESCQCIPRPEAGPRAACELCCRQPGGECLSSFQWNTPPLDVPDMYAKPGTPCNDYNGYCDVFQRCREVDPSGPLSTLRKLLLSDESIASFKRWLIDHWYAVLLIVLATCALLAASTRWLGRRAVNKLKSVTIIHSATTETVRLPDGAQPGVIVHTAVRSKLPLKKKVALKTRAYRTRKENKSKSADASKQTDKNKPSDKNKNTDKSTSTTPVSPVSPVHILPNKKRKTKTSTSVENRTKTAKETTAVVTSGDGKTKHVLLSKHKVKKRKGKLKKETIDYSSVQDPTLPTSPDNDALSKVQKWLMSSPQPVLIPKSKSTPVGLTERTHRSPQKSTRKRASKSSGNLLAGEKARLQVVFKPPFRFSVKICKSDKTKVVLDKSARPEVTKRRSEPNTTEANNSKVAKPSKEGETTVSPVPTAPPVEPQVKYANLPRSASDCKLGARKKSNSQRKETTESRQSLIARDESNGAAHVYENLLATQEFDAPRTCSMPRKTGVARQSSYTHLPRVHVPPRHLNNSVNNIARQPDNLEHFYNTIETLRRPANVGDTNTSSSSSSRHTGDSRVSAASGSKGAPPPRMRYSMPSEHYDVQPLNSSKKLHRQLSEHKLATPVNKCRPEELRGFQLVVGKDKLKRQLSECEVRNAGRGQVCMPVSAGAQPRHADGFQWPGQVPNERGSKGKRASSRGRPHTFGELKVSAAGGDGDVAVTSEDFLKILDS